MTEQDSEELLRNLHLAPYAKPIVSLVDDFPMVQRHKGWQFGFLAGNTTRQMTCALASHSLLPLKSVHDVFLSYCDHAHFSAVQTTLSFF